MLGSGPFVSMGWTPEKGFIPHDWDRYNEATLLYCSRWAARRIRSRPTIWTRWTAEFDKQLGRRIGASSTCISRRCSGTSTAMSGSISAASPTRGCARKGHRPFREQPPRDASPSATMRSPIRAAGPATASDVWGLTACDGPGDFKRVDRRQANANSSATRRAAPASATTARWRRPRAAGRSPFAPEIVLPGAGRDEGALRRGDLRPVRLSRLVQPDAQRSAAGRQAAPRADRAGAVPGSTATISGIDQGPIVAMIANHRDGLVWKAMRRRRPDHRRAAHARASPAAGWTAHEAVAARVCGGYWRRCRWQRLRAPARRCARHLGDGRGGGESCPPCSPRMPGAPKDVASSRCRGRRRTRNC